MTWTDLSAAFGYGTKLTSANMQQLRDNVSAVPNKDSGAPQLATDYIQTAMIEDLQVTEAKLAASVYGQSKVKSSTGTAASSLATATRVKITMQDYCFFPGTSMDLTNVALDMAYHITAASPGTIGCFDIYNHDGSTRNYDIDWRYITATDEPFIFALKNKLTGKMEHLWMCDDPPPGYWGLDDKPDDFIPPILVENPDDYEEIILFKHDQAFLDELRDKRKKDKKYLIDVFNEFEFNKSTKLFKSKNLITV